MNKRIKSNSIRIIAGQWRGRKLNVLDAEGLRPTTDRVRETVFNWLMYEVQGARCLDLFAGTGALGIEALSRGARFVQFVESNQAAARAIEANINTLQAEPSAAQVIGQTAERFLAKPPQTPFDLVFLDPPFADGLLPSMINQLNTGSWLTDRAWVYVEQDVKHAPTDVPAHWRLHREGKAGQSRYRLYSLNTA